MDIKKVYISSDNTAALVCPQCEKAQVIDATKYMNREGEIKIKFTFKCRHCYCGKEHATDCDGTNCKKGHTIVALLERRRHFRKKVNLSGKIRKENGDVSPVVVLDISKKGLLLKIVNAKDYEEGQKVTVKFKLDDPQQSEIKKDVFIRKIISANQLGVEFTSADNFISHADQTIGFYLMS